MQAAFELTDGHERLKAIIAATPSDSSFWNEAQNRFQFVDRLLIECLGWDHLNIKVEETDAAGGRSDYTLGKPAKAVLEAKREAKSWTTLPSGTPKKVRKLKPLTQASAEFADVVTQVIPYCAMRGAPIAIVCNGPQLAIFQALVQNSEPLDGECYLFDGFSDYIENFPLLWTLLSPEGITENRAFRLLAQHRNVRIPALASQNIPEADRFRYRSPLQEELREIGSLLLEEIEDNPELRPEFYRECYVPIEANNRHMLLSKQIIASRYSRVSGTGVTPRAMDMASKTGKVDESFLFGAGSKPIVVIGDVGVGKTSFFENLILNLEDKSKYYIITINLGIKANLSSDLKRFILDSIPDQLNSQYGIDIDAADFVRSIYNDEIKRFDKSIDGEEKSTNRSSYNKKLRQFLSAKVAKRDSHLHQAISHISRGQHRRIILIIDNADQRRFDVQQEAFLIAQELAATRNMFVFISLRPSTFYLSKTTGALAAYQNKILTISPPPADEVIQRRITFALRVAEGKAAPAALDGIRLNLSSIVWFLRATLRSIRTNAEIKQFLSNITGGNTRSVIELITSFCGSPNVDARKIVEIEANTGNYVVPIHEFTKHALLGEYAYYNPQSSLVAGNVYSVSSADPREHFLQALIIAFLSSSRGTRDQDGFAPGDVILEEMTKNGFFEEQISAALVKLASKRLIETPYSHYRELPVGPNISAMSFYYRATSIGLYHIRYWIGSFSFLDAMSTDTPIFDQQSREYIAARAASFEILDRFEKTVAFRNYLESRWHLGNFETSYLDFPATLSLRGGEFAQVARIAHRGPRPGGGR